MKYISTKEASIKWGISTIRITVLANEGRIPGAYRLGKSWLIPADAVKPRKIKANHSSIAQKKTTDFSFPLYHFRPDWNSINKHDLTKQQQILLQAESALLECRFEEVSPMLKPILHDPEDIVTKIGCLWNIGISSIALNKPDDFSRAFLSLQMLLSKNFPHRDDLTVLLDSMQTYVDTIKTAANNDSYNTDIHEHSLPLTCTLIGYAQLTKEAITPGSADTAALELLLRFLQNTGAAITVEMMHIYLLGIYTLRQNITAAQKHAKAAVQIAYDSKLYFPLVTYYRYNTQVLSPIIALYPKEFQKHFQKLISQYEANFIALLSSLNDNSVASMMNEEFSPYIYAVSMGLTSSSIAENLGISLKTVNRKLAKLCKALGVSNKRELSDYLHNYM